MSITAEQWSAISQNLSELSANVQFELNGYQLHVRRVKRRPGVYPLVVVINSGVEGLWGVPHELRGGKCGVSGWGVPGFDFFPITEIFWRKTVKSTYSAKDIIRIKKDWGKRKAEQAAKEKVHWYVPTFNTANSLVRQYKKIQGLKLISIDDGE